MIKQCQKTKKSRRSVYQAELVYDDDQHQDNDETIYDITTPVEMIQTNCYDSIRQVNVNQRRAPSQNNTRIHSYS